MPNPYGYGDVLAAEVERGAVDVRHVDRCVWRVLRAKFEVGLFEHPYPTERIDIAAAAREGSDLSQELARRSIVLAKNDGLLPLTPGGLDIAVIGPHADAPSLQFPTYTYAVLARGQRGDHPGRARHHERRGRRGDRVVRRRSPTGRTATAWSRTATVPARSSPRSASTRAASAPSRDAP